MGVLEAAFAKARGGPRRVVFPEHEDARITAAAARLKDEGLAEPVFLDAAGPAERYVDLLLAARPGLRPALARRLLDKPLYRAAAMVAAGEAAAMVAGAANATRRVIEAASMTIGMATGVRVPSSFFLMSLPDGRALVFADCAVNVAPDEAALVDIARASAGSARRLLGHADVALLSFSSGTSGSGASVETVRAAVKTLHAGGLAAVGPVQGDAALNPAIAAKKGIGSGQANVLIFPSLDAGNIAYKLMQELGGAQAVGPFLQGFARPVCDLSRGAGVQDIVAASAVTLALA